MSPRFYIVNQHNPVGVTDYCVAPTGLLYWGIRSSTGVTPPPMLCICRGQAHKEPVPEWLPPFREKLRVGSLIADLIRNLLRKNKTQRYRDREIIKIFLCHSVPLCWKTYGVRSRLPHCGLDPQSPTSMRLVIKKIGDRTAKQTCPQ